MTVKRFEGIFGFPPEASASAPGRVNLLGEHTDYNEGFVLPTAMPQRTYVGIARSRDGNNHFYAANLARMVSSPPETPPPGSGFASYVAGCLHLVEEEGFSVGPVSLFISSKVPIGAGLSSSAALEVAVLRALRELFHLEFDDVRLAQIAQQAEIRYAHVNCGIMDQMASSLADTTHMLFLDTRTLEWQLKPFPEQADLVVIDSGIPRSLSASAYNERREECEEAARLLGVASLREVTDLAALEQLPRLLRHRARHVVTENNRVLVAARGVDASRFGELMNASHASLRDDFQVSVPQLDLLVELLQEHPDIYGARLTGAGFGGACVALARAGSAEMVSQEVTRLYDSAGNKAKIIHG